MVEKNEAVYLKKRWDTRAHPKPVETARRSDDRRIQRSALAPLAWPQAMTKYLEELRRVNRLPLADVQDHRGRITCSSEYLLSASACILELIAHLDAVVLMLL
jgi:hypothetical protein